jgi:hypothetical protein
MKKSHPLESEAFHQRMASGQKALNYAPNVFVMVALWLTLHAFVGCAVALHKLNKISVWVWLPVAGAFAGNFTVTALGNNNLPVWVIVVVAVQAGWASMFQGELAHAANHKYFFLSKHSAFPLLLMYL